MKLRDTLFYREALNCSLVFASPEEAERLHRIHTALETAKTWGEFRRLMPRDDYNEVVERRREWCGGDELEDDTGDEAPFTSDSVPGYCDGDYPDWLQQRADDFVPEDLLQKYGTQLTTVHNGNYWHLDPKCETELVAELTLQGLECVKREDLKFM